MTSDSRQAKDGLQTSQMYLHRDLPEVAGFGISRCRHSAQHPALRHAGAQSPVYRADARQAPCAGGAAQSTGHCGSECRPPSALVEAERVAQVVCSVGAPSLIVEMTFEKPLWPGNPCSYQHGRTRFERFFFGSKRCRQLNHLFGLGWH